MARATVRCPWIGRRNPMGEKSTARTARYLARVEARLSVLANDAARRQFLAGEIEKWEERYARFIATEGESHRRNDGPDQPSAFDFVETLMILCAAQARFVGSKNI
jgi:hypothetical protein